MLADMRMKGNEDDAETQKEGLGPGMKQHYAKPPINRSQPSCGTKLEPKSRDTIWRWVAHHANWPV